MKKKLSKFGNSMALVIDKPILRLLNIEPSTELEIKIVDHSILISPIIKGSKKRVSRNIKTQLAYDKITEKYAEALKKLAK